MTENAKKIRMPWIIAGICFLFNPSIVLIDFLPDFIGCIFLMYGLGLLRDIAEYFNDAYKGIRRLLWISLLHIPAFLLTMRILFISANEDTTILIFVFIFSIVECVLLSVIFSNFLDGFVYVGQRCDGQSAFYVPASKRRVKKGRAAVPVSSLRTLLVAFFVAKAFLEIAPELVHLQVMDEFSAYRQQLNLRNYEIHFIVLALIVAIILIAIVLPKLIKYLLAVAREGKFMDSLVAVYSVKMVPGHKVFVYRRYMAIFTLAMAAALCGINIYMDNVNVVPNVISALLFFIAAAMLYKDTKLKKQTLLITALYAVLSLVTTVISIKFVDEYSFNAVGHFDAADQAFAWVQVFTIAEAVLMVLTFAAFTACVYSIIKQHFAHDNSLNHYSSGKNEYIISSLRRRLIATVIMAVLSAGTTVGNLYAMVGDRSIVVGSAETELITAYIPRFEGFWMIQLAVTIVWVAYTVTTYSRLKSEFKDKFDIL